MKPGQKKRKILIVDDEADVVNSLRHFLSVRGFDALGASSAEEALAVLEKEQADLVVLDIMMPGLKGTEAAKIIKAKYPSIRLIVVTGYQEEFRDFLADQRLDAAFSKPLEINMLYDKLLKILGTGDSAVEPAPEQNQLKARVLFVKAKLLFIEPSIELYGFLSRQFKMLIAKGQDYQPGLAQDETQAMEKINNFAPDICLINASFFRSFSTAITSKIAQSGEDRIEIIVYDIGGIQDIPEIEMEKMAKSVEKACFRRGLLEFKYIDI